MMIRAHQRDFARRQHLPLSFSFCVARLAFLYIQRTQIAADWPKLARLSKLNELKNLFSGVVGPHKWTNFVQFLEARGFALAPKPNSSYISLTSAPLCQLPARPIN